jgi:DNA primase
MARIARASIDQVQATVDMVDLVSQYTDLRKAGANYSGRCPFHEERTPSFSVNPTEKLFYCFGCGAGGNLFGFVQQKENLDFAAAVEYLADRYGIALEYDESSARGDAERRQRERQRGLLEQSTSYYERVLNEAPAAAAAREYLESRRLSNDVCRAFRLGYSLPGWGTLRDAARAAKFRDDELVEAGLAIPGKRGEPYDRFRGRIMFPLADDRGRTLGFGARTMGDEKPKYLNSPETLLYHKSEALFGLDKARASAGKEDRVYVVEGYTDVLALVQAGIPNVVASMGTSLTEQQLRRLARVTSNLYLCFDADAAGIGAMSRALALGRRLGLALHVVRIPDGLDPADYVLSPAGAEGFRRLVAHAQTLLQFHVRLALDSNDLERPDGRARAFARLKGVLAEAATPIERDEELRYIADRMGLSSDAAGYLLVRDGRAVVSGAGSGVTPSRGGEAGDAASRRGDVATAAIGGSHELEVRFLAGCVAQPEAGREVLAGVDEGFFAGAETRAAFRRVMLRLGLETAGNTLQEAQIGDAPGDEGEAFAEVMVRSARERFSAAVVRELFLRLQEAQVSRLIARFKLTGEAEEDGQQGGELARLYAVRHRLRDAIRATPVDDHEPDEG